MAADYFKLLGLAPAFDIDLAALEEAYFREQRQYHPDRFIGRPAVQRQLAMQRSVDINEAYHALKAPRLRACYLLARQHIIVGKERDSIKPSPELLAEVMEWRESITDAPPQQLDEMATVLRGMHDQSVTAIGGHYKKEAWEAMAQETLRLGYIIKTQEEVAQRKQQLSAKQAS